MPLDASIPLSVQPVKFNTPFESLGRAMELRQQQQASELQRQQIAENARLAKERAQQQASADALSNAYKASLSPDGTYDRAKLQANLNGLGLAAQVPAIFETLDKADEANAKARTAKTDADRAEMDYVKLLGSQMQASDFAPSIVNGLLTVAQAHGHDVGQYKYLFDQQPDQFKAFVSKLVAPAASGFTLSPGETRFENGKPVASVPAAAPKSPAVGSFEDYLTKKYGPQPSADQIAKGRADFESAGRAPAADDVPLNLTPEALKLTAHQYAMTGQLPPMGMGKQGAAVRTSIINEAAKEYAGLDLPSQVAAFKANQASLQNITGTLDTLTAFENTAGKNLKQFTDLAAKLPDTGVPWLNTPVRVLNESMLGSADQKAAYAAGNVALREIARVTNDPKLSGNLTDNARKSVNDLIASQNATLPQILAVVKMLQADMQNVHTSLSQQKSDIAQRIATPPGGMVPTPKSGPAVGTKRTANGETRTWNGSAWVK